MDSETELLPVAESTAELVTLRCDRHGAYTAYRTAPPAGHAPALLNDCPKCIDERQFDLDRESRDTQSAKLRQRKMRELADIASIPPRFATCGFDDYQVTPGNSNQSIALRACRSYAHTWTSQVLKGGSLVLTGSTGTGKTRLACAVANQIIPKHLACVAFGTVSSIIRTIRSTYGKTSHRTETQAIANLLVPDLLIIDEIGASAGTEHELGLLFEIINKRYENLRPMILTSNLNQADLQKYLGHRAMDRFAECGTVLAFDWASHRGKVPA